MMLHVAACCLLLVLASNISDVKHPTRVKIKAISPRPLAEVLEEVRQIRRWDVSYEGPIFEQSETTRTWRRVPAVKPLVFEVDDPKDRRVGRDGFIRAIVAQYNRSGNPGHYEVKFVGNKEAVVVGTARGAKGAVPVFSTRISLPKEKRTIAQTLDLIFARVGAARGIRIDKAGIALTALNTQEVEIGGENLEARELMFRALAALPVAVHWTAGHDPETEAYYVSFTPSMD